MRQLGLLESCAVDEDICVNRVLRTDLSEVLRCFCEVVNGLAGVLESSDPNAAEPVLARILIAWELGNGCGHIARLLPLAVELKRRGHEPTLVPTQGEQQMLSKQVEMLGAGLTALPGERPPDFKQLLSRVLNEPGFARRARSD